MAGRCPPALEIEKNPLNLRYLREIKSPLAGRCPPALEIEKYPLEYNDLLFNRTNSKELVGKVAIYKSEIPAIYAGY